MNLAPRAFLISAVLAAGVLTASAGHATGLATCDSGPQAGWQPEAKLTAQLQEKGWRINRVKIDGGCYEVYAITDKGVRVEAYFHPVTLAPVPTNPR